MDISRDSDSSPDPLRCSLCGKVRHASEEVCPMCGCPDFEVVEAQDVDERDWAV